MNLEEMLRDERRRPAPNPLGARTEQLVTRVRRRRRARAAAGVAAGVAHPGRALMTLGAVLVGVAAVVFAIGMKAVIRRASGLMVRTEWRKKSAKKVSKWRWPQ